MTVGSLLAAAGFLLLIPAGPDSSPWLYLPGIVVAGAGIFSAMTAQGQVFVKAVSDQAYGAVTSSKTTVSQLGSALGMVFTMLFLKVFMGLDLYRDLKAAGATEEDVHATVSTLQAAAETGGTDSSAFPAAVMLAAAAAVWLLMRERTRPLTSPEGRGPRAPTGWGGGDAGGRAAVRTREPGGTAAGAAFTSRRALITWCSSGTWMITPTRRPVSLSCTRASIASPERSGSSAPSPRRRRRLEAACRPTAPPLSRPGRAPRTARPGSSRRPTA